MATYESVREDWEYLFETIGAADDMTGGYEDQYDLDLMLKKPTKTQAKKCMVSQIVYWFQVGPDNENTAGRLAPTCIEERDRLLREDIRVEQIFAKYI